MQVIDENRAAIIRHSSPRDCLESVIRKWRLAHHTDLVQVNSEISMPNSLVHETGTRPGSRREAALNWLALGLLLAAWNASDNDASPSARSRPEALRGYSYVSVRAMQRMASLDR
jgi:hypothetical protein